MHLISKKTTNGIKAFAILIVVFGHYARFKQDPLPIASHIAYFGAAIFAFLSGYGQFISYRDKGLGSWGGYIRSRVKRVYVPFVIINILAIPVYGLQSGNNVISRILLGTDDSIMWYPVFIMFFYIFFGTIYCFKICEKAKLTLLFAVIIFSYIAMNICHMPSQWYTSIFPLIGGILIACNEDRVRQLRKSSSNLVIGSAVLILLLSAFFTRTINGTIKYFITGISGLSLVIFIFFGSIRLEMLIEKKVFGIISLIGMYSYWCYLVHMKVFAVIDKMMGTDGMISFLLFIVLTVLITAIVGIGWNRVKSKAVRFTEDCG